MQVRVVSALPSSSCKEYLHVQTCTDPNDDTVTLATIQRIVDKIDEQESTGSKIIKRVKTLIMRRPMSPDDALGLATSYAARKKIEVVYTDSALARD